MKRSFTKMLALGSALLLMFAACKKEGDMVVFNQSNVKAGALTASTTNVALSKSTLTNTAVSFSSTDANFGYSAAASSTLQIAAKGNNFANTKEVALSGKNVSVSFNVQDFNNMLLALNLPTGTASQVEVRMKYTIANSVSPVYSNVITLTATPFALVSYVYVPGNYQGWLPGSADSLKSATGNGVYTGIIDFGNTSDLSFKVTSDKKGTIWYGTLNGAVSGSGSASNFTAPGKGKYVITIDFNANTIVLTPANYYSVIGDASKGWDTDVDMKYDNGNDVWKLSTTLTSGGGFKIRKNHDWGISYGLLAQPDGKTLTSANGGNIGVSSTGTYNITFAVDATDATKASYTLTKQ